MAPTFLNGHTLNNVSALSTALGLLKWNIWLTWWLIQELTPDTPGDFSSNALASNALYRYRNAVLRNCNALFDFQMTLFYVLDNLVFAVRALLAKIVALFAKIIR